MVKKMHNSLKNDFDVVIIGLGYVGLTLAVSFANAGLKILGVEKRKEVVDLANSGTSHFYEPGLDELLSSQIETGALTVISNLIEVQDLKSEHFIITVGTPLDQDGNCNLDFMRSAVNEIAPFVSQYSTVILRSTVMVGTCREEVHQFFKKIGIECCVAMCPERTVEGAALEEISTVPQVIGAVDQRSFLSADNLFRKLTKMTIKLGSLEAAEILKLADNTYRDVTFAFGNEVAKICEAYSVTASEVISAGKINYKRTNIALPGLVGGPCLEKDPHIFAESARKKGVELNITKAARNTNENQPEETIKDIKLLISSRQKLPIKKVCMLGIAFKGHPATDDLRGSMAFPIFDAVKKNLDPNEINFFDPHVSKETLLENFYGIKVMDNLMEAVCGADLCLIVNNHKMFKEMDINQVIESMNSNGMVYDYWNNFDRHLLPNIADNYYSLGSIHQLNLKENL